MFGLFKKKQVVDSRINDLNTHLSNKPKDISQYTREDLMRLAQKYNGNVVGGFLIEQGIIKPYQITADGYTTDPDKHLIAQNAERSLLQHFGL